MSCKSIKKLQVKRKAVRGVRRGGYKGRKKKKKFFLRSKSLAHAEIYASYTQPDILEDRCSTRGSPACVMRPAVTFVVCGDHRPSRHEGRRSYLTAKHTQITGIHTGK
jgi:hypothetical protein